MSLDDRKNDILAKIKKEVIRRMESGGNMIRSATMETVSGQGNGRWYGKHQASKPGEPPAVDTGALKNSWNSGIDVKERATVTEISTYAKSNLATSGKSPDFNYAFIDKGFGRVKPRPYVDKSREKAYKKLKKKLEGKYYV